MHVHLVFVAKYRRKKYLNRMPLRSYAATLPVYAPIFDVELVEMDGEADHVHLLVNYPPKISGIQFGEQPQRGIQSVTPS
ncbi:transposase [Erwinia tracheiphila]